MGKRELINEIKEGILSVYGYGKNQNKISKKKESEQPKNTSQLSSIDFLRFAQEDLKNTYGEHGIVNCLTNCKRAIDCQIDELIKKLGYLPLSQKKRWSIPQKIQFLKEFGVIAPRILEKVNILRNDLEHRFKVPTINEAEDALDVAILFIAYADLVELPSLNWGVCSSGIHVKYDYDEMSFNFLREIDHKMQLIDLGIKVRYGEQEFTELYDFFMRIVPNLK